MLAYITREKFLYNMGNCLQFKAKLDLPGDLQLKVESNEVGISTTLVSLYDNYDNFKRADRAAIDHAIRSYLQMDRPSPLTRMGASSNLLKDNEAEHQAAADTKTE